MNSTYATKNFKRKKPCIMIQGTMSGVGKSLITAGLCRIFSREGFKVAPFKSQNMALNSYVTKDNLEIGRAQAVQARAAGVDADVRMNPILLKPTSDIGSQVILNGKPLANMSASKYFSSKAKLIPDILKAYKSLEDDFDLIVIEGAGSPAEINLKHEDIVNMGLAEMLDAPVLLVADIDPGGVFAQLYGTIKLLEENEQARIKGMIINKFRGDISILESGIGMLEEKTGKKLLGCIPYADVQIEEEDSLAKELSVFSKGSGTDIAVIKLPHMSNFTDFEPLGIMDNVSVRYVRNTKELSTPDLIIIPGTKSTIADLIRLRESGLEAAILKLNREKNEVPVIGICGGFQMLGNSISDPLGVEGEIPFVKGMGLLNMDTVFENEKITSQYEGILPELQGFFVGLSKLNVKGYEIHSGRSFVGEEKAPIILSDGNVLGTYIHGFFDRFEIREALSLILGCESKSQKGISWKEYEETQLDKLADILKENLDMDKIYKIAGV